MSDDEMGARAQVAALEVPANSFGMRVGVVSFWAVVALLLTVRAFVIDPAALKPFASTAVPVVLTAAVPGATF